MEKITDKQIKLNWPILFFFATLIALLNIGIIITNELANENNFNLTYQFINEFTGTFTTLPLIVPLIWFFRQYPITLKYLIPLILLHIGASLVYGFSHTTLIYVSRKLIYYLAGFGDYDKYYGILSYRYLMEYQKQFIVYWLIYGTVVMFNTWQESQQAKLQAVTLQEELTQARLQALRMQLNPHFLFNTLNMISATMYDNIKAADRMIANLSDLLRLTLHRDNRNVHPLKEELRLLNFYLEIMKARFEDRLKIDLEISEDCLPATVPGFFLQPLLENSIKYGMENLDIAQIKISANKTDELLNIQILDNGPGFTGSSEDLLQDGVGLANTAQRLETIYGKHHQFSFKNRNSGGFAVDITIPYNTVEDA